MANTNIPLSVQSLDTATPIRQGQADANNNAMATEQILKQHYDNMDSRERSRLTSTIAGAVQLKSFLDNNDVEGANNFLMNRRNALHTRMAHGENVDTQETDAALEMLQGGRIDELKQGVAGLMAAGQVYGIIKGGNEAPSDVQTAEWYRNATPEQRKAFDQTKRAQTTLNLGGTQAVLGSDGQIAQQYNVTPKVTETPEYNKQVAKAETQGKNEGEREATAQNILRKVDGAKTAIQALMTASAQAPSGAIMDTAAMLSNKSGIGGKAAVNQGTFQVKRGAAENAIRDTFRIVGSGAQTDADAKPIIEMLPSDTDAEDVKVAKTQAAMEALQAKVEALAQERGLLNPMTQGGAPAGGQGGKIRVTNGTETFEIDPADLPAAQAEGFQQQ